MASIGREGTKGERKRLIYRDANGRQQSLRLGKCSDRAAQSALAGFERVLESDRIGCTLHPDGVRWLESIDDRLHARVARLGLCEPREAAAVVTLGELLERFEHSASVKPATLATYKQACENLRQHFGEDRDVRSITPADADGWRRVLDESGLAPSTVAKRIKTAKQIYWRAIRWGLAESNPFADVRAGSMANPDRSHYVDAETVRAVLDACPDEQWRAIVGLSRLAGLRCPSEIAALRWGDVNWARGRLTVRSPKTAGHEGHAVRVVPIAPELRPILLALFEQAEPGAEAVVPRLAGPSGTSANLRTTFHKIILKAGVKPWPRPFHNMRASCATDWVERFPAHVVAGWLGHSPMIAARHYLQTRDTHFEMAAGLESAASNPATSAASNAATHARPHDPTEDHNEPETPEKQAVLVGSGSVCDSVENARMTPAGFEPALPG